LGILNPAKSKVKKEWNATIIFFLVRIDADVL
jgi:hypothetical protein